MVTMSEIDTLHKLDLNLLVTLKVLLEEKNVTRSALKLNLSQSTVSHQLAKLRDLFNDPLLVPSYRGMQPTCRAKDIQKILVSMLLLVGEIIQPPESFAPDISNRTWKISASDYVGNTFIYPKVAKIREMAPLSRLSIIDIRPDHIYEQLVDRELDLAFHIMAESPKGLRSRRVFTEHYVLAGRKNHPAFSKPLDIDAFCNLKHIVVSKSQGGFWGIADEVLKNRKMKRDVVVSIPDFSSLVPLIEQTDLVALIPSRLANAYSTLTIIRPPLDLPSFDLCMLWSEQVHRDPAHIWLRNVLVDG